MIAYETIIYWMFSFNLLIFNGKKGVQVYLSVATLEVNKFDLL